MQVKTSELKGGALDWAVAKAEGHEIYSLIGGAVWYWIKCSLTGELETADLFRPSADWAQGGSIIERERITLRVDTRFGAWVAFLDSGRLVVGRMTGPTALTSAMRCYVASKLGNTIEIPDELV
jgi:hypothetical protein